MSEKHPHLGPWTLLPVKVVPGKCQECATEHTPDFPHNAQSMAYQYDFYGKHGRWPTWGDAMAHCTPEMQEQWKEGLRENGIAEDQLKPSKA